jgi:hypothetical protein
VLRAYVPVTVPTGAGTCFTFYGMISIRTSDGARPSAFVTVVLSLWQFTVSSIRSGLYLIATTLLYSMQPLTAKTIQEIYSFGARSSRIKRARLF